jgi:hypothetical protein
MKNLVKIYKYGYRFVDYIPRDYLRYVLPFKYIPKDETNNVI